MARSALDALFLMLQIKKQDINTEKALEPANDQYLRNIPRRLPLENATWESLMRTRIALDLDVPEINLTRGALIGAPIGTAIMPGVGTGTGTSVGDKLDHGFKKLFSRYPSSIKDTLL